LKADLHVHTSYTDCSDTPEEVFRMAKNNGVTLISITDHDTMYGVEEHRVLAEKYGVQYIPGIEISAYDYKRNKSCHIIGLYVQSGFRALDDMIASTTKQRHSNGVKQVEKLIALGYDISLEDFKETRGIHGFYKQHIMEVLIKKGYASNIYGEFYCKMFKNSGPLEMRIAYPSHIDATRALRESGAIPILAHPTVYDNLDALKELVSSGLMGIEASYPSVTTKQSERIKELAMEHSLFLSAGSDYHGRYGERNKSFVGSNYINEFELLR